MDKDTDEDEANEQQKQKQRRQQLEAACKNGDLASINHLCSLLPPQHDGLFDFDIDAAAAAAGDDSLSGYEVAIADCAMRYIQLASENGHWLVAERLLDEVVCKYSSVTFTRLIIMASERGCARTVNRMILLQQHKNIRIARYGGDAIRAAASSGHTEVVAILLRAILIDSSGDKKEQVRTSSSSSREIDLNFAMLDAAKEGHVEVLDLLLREAGDRVHPAFGYNEAIIVASERNHVSVVERLMLDCRVDPSDQHNAAIMMALDSGHRRVVESLLKDNRVDPSNCIVLAALNGHVDVVDCLICYWIRNNENLNNAAWVIECETALLRAIDCNLFGIVNRLMQPDVSDRYIDPSLEYNLPIRMAARRGGNVDIVDCLLQDARVDPSALNNSAIHDAAEHGHFLVVDRLMRDARVDPSALNNRALLDAVRGGHLAIVERLMLDCRVDPSDNQNLAILTACHKGCLDIANRLLLDERVDPSAEHNLAIQLASMHGHVSVVERLMQDSRVDPSSSTIIRRAAITTIDCLLRDVRVNPLIAYTRWIDSRIIHHPHFPSDVLTLMRMSTIIDHSDVVARAYDPDDRRRETLAVYQCVDSYRTKFHKLLSNLGQHENGGMHRDVVDNVVSDYCASDIRKQRLLLIENRNRRRRRQQHVE